MHIATFNCPYREKKVTLRGLGNMDIKLHGDKTFIWRRKKEIFLLKNDL